MGSLRCQCQTWICLCRGFKLHLEAALCRALSGENHLLCFMELTGLSQMRACLMFNSQRKYFKEPPVMAST